MTNDEWDEPEERAERIDEVKAELSNLINRDPKLGTAYELELANDILYEGPLAALLEFFQENRSKLEELN